MIGGSNHLSSRGSFFTADGCNFLLRQVYRATIPFKESGKFGFVLRILPKHPLLVHPADMGLARVATDDRPYTDLMTVDWTVANDALLEAWPLEEVEDGRGRPRAAVDLRIETGPDRPRHVAHQAPAGDVRHGRDHRRPRQCLGTQPQAPRLLG